ncbi:hypothetical protein Tco_0957865 [Tanacetum coccineum]
MGGRAGRGGGRTESQPGDQGNGRNDGQGGRVGGQGSEVNDSVDGVPDFSTIIAQQLQNLLLTIVAQVSDQGRGQRNGRNQNSDAINDNILGDGYDGKGGAIVYTYWIEKIESVQDMSGCGDNQKVKYIAGSFVGEALTWSNSQIRTLGREKLETELWNHVMVGAGHAAYTDRFYDLARLVPHLVTPKNRRIERNGSIKKNTKKRGNRGEPSKDRNGRDDNKRTRTGNAFATTANPVRREYTGHPRHFAKDCRVVPRNVNPINARNPTARTCYECGSTNHIKAAYPRLNQAQRP